MEFKLFLESQEQDVEKTLKKIPKKYRNLVKGYQFKFQPGNTLKNDPNNIGEVDEKKKTITVAGPWNYSRELTILHEIGHLIYKYILSKEQKEKWTEIVKNTSMEKKDRQNAEEMFCMSYGNYYANRPVVVYSHPKWINFIKNL